MDFTCFHLFVSLKIYFDPIENYSIEHKISIKLVSIVYLNIKLRSFLLVVKTYFDSIGIKA
jgi:hypothetical protein